MLYRYFIFYSAILPNGNVAYKHIFLDLDREIDNEKTLSDVEQFLLNQNSEIKNLVVNNFCLVKITEKEGDDNG